MDIHTYFGFLDKFKLGIRFCGAHFSIPTYFGGGVTTFFLQQVIALVPEP